MATDMAAWRRKARELRGPLDPSALVRELSEHLLLASTATHGLHAWCAARRLSAGPITAVKQDPDRRRYLDDDMLDELRPERHERIAHRCVRLVRGPVVLSEADNWFIPDRLPPDVNDLLEATDVPFGAAISPLGPSRRTYFVRFAEWSAGATPADLSPSMPILEHKAVVLDRNGQPLAVVSERYRAALLGGATQRGVVQRMGGEPCPGGDHRGSPAAQASGQIDERRRDGAA